MTAALAELFLNVATLRQQELDERSREASFHRLMTHIGPEAIAEALQRPDLKIKGTAGNGNRPDVLWFAIFNPESTTSAKSGVYVVYLFSADLQRLFLCQGQGVTRVEEEFGRGKRSELMRRSQLICERVPEHKKGFTPGSIALGGSTKLAKDYDNAIAYSKGYSLSRLPSEDVLRTDLLRAIELYDLLITRGGTDSLETALQLGGDDAGKNLKTFEEQKRYVRHTRIERNASVSKAVKKAHGTTCQGCGFNFESFYGEHGKSYIEAHHLIPLHLLPEGKPVGMNPKTDFAVLCANCHRMVHRGAKVLKLEELQSLPEVRAFREDRKKFVR